MSLMGQKQTSATNGMSAMPPIADVQRPLWHVRQSAKTGSRLTYSITSSARAKTDGGIIDAKRLCGLQIDHQFELCWVLFDRQITRLYTLENSVDERMQPGGIDLEDWLRMPEANQHPRILSQQKRSAVDFPRPFLRSGRDS